MAFCAGGSLNSKQPRCCCCSRPAGGSAPLRGSEHAAATRWLPPWALGAGGEPRIGLFVVWEVPLWTSFWPGQRVAVSCWGSGASWGRPRLAVLFLPTPELQEGLRAPGSSGGEEARWGCSLGKPRLPAAAAAARCHPRLEERTAGPALPGGALAAAASAPRVGALRVVCEGWEPCLAPPEGHTATLSAHREGCSLPRCSHASFGSPQLRRAAGSKQNLRLRVGRSTRIKARFPFLFYFVQKRCN